MREGGSKKQALLSQLREDLGQEHLFAMAAANGSGKLSAEEQSLVDQLIRHDESYDGGWRVCGKGEAAKVARSCNPLEGWIPSVPEGLMMHRDDRFRAAERAGLQSACGLCFVLVAGGRERLVQWHPGRPARRNRDFFLLEVYAKSILGRQMIFDKFGVWKNLPLAIMTSDDTHDSTRGMLQKNGYFEQVGSDHSAEAGQGRCAFGLGGSHRTLPEQSLSSNDKTSWSW